MCTRYCNCRVLQESGVIQIIFDEGYPSSFLASNENANRRESIAFLQ